MCLGSNLLDQRNTLFTLTPKRFATWAKLNLSLLRIDRTFFLKSSEYVIQKIITKTKYFSYSIEVYCPEAPRAPHHLALSFKREVRGIADISALENEELFSSLRKIAEIYETIGISGFVVAQFDTPQLGHQERFVVEVIPHLPGFGDIKNIVDKMDCNRHVLFRSANLSPIKYDIDEKEV